jgi:ABC-type nitrate/sulfonate/bicarbonate transport system, permease component
MTKSRPVTASGRAVVRFLAILAALALWQVGSANHLSFGLNFENIPSPVRVAAEIASLVTGQDIWTHVLVSVRRVAIGFALAAVLGIVAGLAMGRYWVARDVMLPYIEILRPIPAVAWIPLAILMWPTEESSILFITFLGALFPVVLNTVHGVEQTPEILVRAARSLGAREADIFLHVVLPGALPSISTGLAIGMGVSWFSLLAGEIISGQYGVGYFTWVSYTLVQYPRIIVGMLAIGGLGTLSTWLVRRATRPLLAWQGGNW